MVRADMMGYKRHAMRLTAVFSLLACTIAPVRASEAPASAVHASGQPVVHGDHAHVHFEAGYCGTDVHSEEAHRHLAAFDEARSSGALTAFRAGKGGVPPTVGDEQNFNVSEGGWMPLDFRLVDVQDGAYYLWVEIAELDNGNVTPSEIESLRQVLLHGTPSTSVDPTKGILENNHSVFGQAPDVD
ncbi:MAG: hypothetical protein HKN17_01370, partial [Rhodothermales bacterium]|nr:hypothetical protein [Rhodothermales bacterium]